jgi:Zn-dependent metalloprotease
MRKSIVTILASFFCILAFSQNSPEGNFDPFEIRSNVTQPYDVIQQQRLRSQTHWENFVATNGTWYVHFDEKSGMPHRAYGAPISISGNSIEEKAIQFAHEKLAQYQIDPTALQSFGNTIKGKYTYVNFRQTYQNIEVLGSRYMVKFFNDNVVAFGCDLYPILTINTTPTISESQAKNYALAGISNQIRETNSNEELYILPVIENSTYAYYLAYKVVVKTIAESGVPANYETLVDAHTGELLSRINTVKHSHAMNHGHPGKPCKNTCTNDQMMAVTATITGQVHLNNPYDTPLIMGLPNIYLTSSAVNYQADQSGELSLPLSPNSSATVRLEGPWSRIYSDGVTPSLSVTLLDGQNDISLNAVSNVKERSAYRSVQRIHDFMKEWMPTEFDGMDFQLPTNIDVAGDCNAFYDGQSINFYDIGAGCNATSLVADVCYHEYGHGINDNYYQSQGGNFNNGAMGEGYADFWAIACSNTPLLGVGFYTENEDPLRRYDQGPRVYPSDISGEVHNDGEIIMGAWWDTHLLMGGDWNITMPLFVETYAGLQAETNNGNEGVAYTDVLIDLLQADDDDGDITNGTPHGDAIIQGFYIHGITLISNAELSHSPLLFASASEALEFNTTLDLQFPFTQYLQSVNCYYKINTGEWITAAMNEEFTNDYYIEIPGQPAGTVIGYYFGTLDLNGSLSAVIPIGSQLVPSANLPFFRMIGVQQIGIHDSDNNEFFGTWQLGVSGDNASTGEWEEDAPLGSFSETPVTVVQPNIQHTPDGEFCFITGNASGPSSPLGENDVDAGKTTLQTPLMNLTTYINPVFAYWRWYTNSPVGGANPGQDYWQVRITNNNGNTWTYIENTKASDASWRRNAFRIADYVTPTAQVRVQFIASDSTHVGQNLDGGSLVEAAVDDFTLYESLAVGVDEIYNIESSLTIYPNPARDKFSLNLNTRNSGPATIRMFDASGQTVFEKEIKLTRGLHSYPIENFNLASGIYSIVVKTATEKLENNIYIID